MNHTTRYLSKGTLALLGVGAAASGALGMYLYKSPRLRRQMRKAASMREAANVLTHQIREDSTEVANNAVATMAGGVATGLKKARFGLGTRFLRRRHPAEREARHLRSEAKHSARAAKNAVRHAAATAKNEAAHMRDEVMDSAHHVAREA